MCLMHWWMVPPNLQKAVWSTYRKGQGMEKRPSLEWIKAAKAAISFVAMKEGKI